MKTFQGGCTTQNMKSVFNSSFIFMYVGLTNNFKRWLRCASCFMCRLSLNALKTESLYNSRSSDECIRSTASPTAIDGSYARGFTFLLLSSQWQRCNAGNYINLDFLPHEPLQSYSKIAHHKMSHSIWSLERESACSSANPGRGTVEAPADDCKICGAWAAEVAERTKDAVAHRCAHKVALSRSNCPGIHWMRHQKK